MNILSLFIKDENAYLFIKYFLVFHVRWLSLLTVCYLGVCVVLRFSCKQLPAVKMIKVS